MNLAPTALLSCLLLSLSLACTSEVTPEAGSNASDASDASDSTASAKAAAGPAISFGNGSDNSITTEGIKRVGATFTFREVMIKGPGWLVLHPFRDGKPVGEIYSGASYLEDGLNRDVEISVEQEPAPGTMFLVMLHSDVNQNREFDFVFVDERNVLDKAVFEGTRMIAHPFATP